MAIPPQQLDFPSLAFPKDRSVLMVGEVAARLRVSEQHIVDLIEEGKMAAVDIAGKHAYVRLTMTAFNDIAKRLGVTTESLLETARAATPQRGGSRAHYRIPVVEGFTAFVKENHSLSVSGK
jgi:excisionase family DNA binding protein